MWWYGDGRTLLHLWRAPVEEYLFTVVQPWLTALWLSHFDGRAEWLRTGHPVVWRVVAFGVAVGIDVLGWWLLGSGGGVYLGAVLTWAAPVLAIQWVVGAPQL